MKTAWMTDTVPEPKPKKKLPAAPPFGNSWVAFFRYLIDELWFEHRNLNHAKRFEYISYYAWKELLKLNKFKTSPYRRRTWLRLLREKRTRVKRIIWEEKRGAGIAAPWIK